MALLLLLLLLRIIPSSCQGVTFSNFHVNTPVCCPSRINLLTGRYTHNTNLTDVIPPYGELHYCINCR